MNPHIIRRVSVVAVFCAAVAVTIATSPPPPPVTLNATFNGDPVVLDRDAPVATQRVHAQFLNVPSSLWGNHALSVSACAEADDGGTSCYLLPVTVRLSLERDGGLIDHRIAYVPSYLDVPAFRDCAPGPACEEILSVEFELALDAGFSSATVGSWILQTWVESYDEAADGGVLLLEALP